MNKMLQENLTLLLSNKYEYSADTKYDYSDNPRPCHNFVFMLEGQAIVESDGNSFFIKKGDIIYIPKNTTYRATWKASPRVVFHSLHFCFQPRIGFPAEKNIPVQILPNADFNDWYSLVERIKKTQFSDGCDYFFAMSDFYSLCGKIFPYVKTLPDKFPDKDLSPAIYYIESHYKEKISVNYLASLCYLSLSRFFYFFKRQKGISPISYKNQIAIHYASQDLLIEQNKSVAEIAEAHGFSSVVFFERQFKKIIGQTPSQYRKDKRIL